MPVSLPDSIPQVQPDPIVPVRDKKRQDQELKDQFLTLFLAQLQNQDPLQPMTDTEMTQQMAQFGQLEQLFNLNSNFDALGKVLVSLNTLQASSLIGRTVKAQGETIEVEQGVPETIAYTLPENVHTLNVVIESETGDAVKKSSIDDSFMKGEGQHDMIWDGLNNLGQPVPDGVYRVRFEAKRLDDSPVPVQQYLDGKVTSVSLENGIVVLKVGDKELHLEDVIEIRE